MTDARAWPIRPKWHRFETPKSYARRQCAAAGIPFDYVERGLTTQAQPYINRVWYGGAGTATTVEAAAGRAEGHFLRLHRLAQPGPAQTYPERYLCRLCAAGDHVEQIPHDRENWCLRHSGQMVWTGPGTTPESQQIVPFDRTVAKAERRFRRLVAAGRIDARLHSRVWEMVRDNAWLTHPSGWKPELLACVDDHEIRGRAALYPETVTILIALSSTTNIERWTGLPSENLRQAIFETLPPMIASCRVLVERIVLWLRPLRREVRPTRIDPLKVPLDVVNVSAAIDTTAPYAQWIQRNPHAVAEWDWSRNDAARDPWDPIGVMKNAWWVCDDGHTWQANPFTRGYSMTRCPYCVGQRVWPGHTDLASTHPDLAAEWDGAPGRNVGDPDHISATSGRRIHWICRQGHRWDAPIRNRAKRGYSCPYCAGKRPVVGETDLATLRPEIAADWDYSGNGHLGPTLVGLGSSKKVWWIAKCGHHWQTTIYERTSERRAGCPFCSNRTVLVGFNDLATTHPDLVAQWATSNQKTPEEVTHGSTYRAGWICELGHAWTAAVCSRVLDDCGCPFCANHAVLPGFNDLATLDPELAAQWDTSPGANDKTPSDLTIGSKYHAGWRCRAGHNWHATVASRAAGHGCPYCAGRFAIPGETDLTTLRPKLAAEWDPNNSLSPEGVTCSSNQKVAWRCAKGHSWRATVANRSALGSGCPYCAGQRALPGETDLATLRPDLAAEWASSNELPPDQVTCFSNRTASWFCSEGHTWHAIIANRTRGTGCPYCAEKRPIRGEPDRAPARQEHASDPTSAHQRVRRSGGSSGISSSTTTSST